MSTVHLRVAHWGVGQQQKRSGVAGKAEEHIGELLEPVRLPNFNAVWVGLQKSAHAKQSQTCNLQP